MSMYGYDISFYDYGFSDPSVNNPIYGNPIIDYDDHLYAARRRPPVRQRDIPSSTPTVLRHDGSSPLPLGMEWSLPPRVWVFIFLLLLFFRETKYPTLDDYY